MGQHVRAGDLDIWTEQVGQGPDVLLIGGLGDTVESWQFQLDGLADRYRLTAFDNRARAGRCCLRAPSRPRRWPTTRPRSSRRSALARPTSPASPWEAPSPRSWPCATPSCPQPRAHQHLRPPGRPLALPAELLALAGGGGAERACLLRGLLHLGLHPPRARRRFGGPDRRGGPAVPPPAVRGGLSGPGRGVRCARHGRPPRRDRRADAGPVR